LQQLWSGFGRQKELHFQTWFMKSFISSHTWIGISVYASKLITSPGHMQREYIEGNHARHQKPFAMFFICATVFALLTFWINVILMNYMRGGNAL
jgi:hypothetical protein